MWKSLRVKILRGNVEDKGVNGVSIRNIFSCLLAKILNLCELGVCSMAPSSQNLERVGVIDKILQNKELALLPWFEFPVSGLDLSYCFWLNTKFVL